MIVYPLLFLLHLALIPIGILFIVLSSRRDDSQVCVECSYDLRGSQSLRCPECGNVIAVDGPRKRPWAACLLAAGIAVLLIPIGLDLLLAGFLIHQFAHR